MAFASKYLITACLLSLPCCYSYPMHAPPQKTTNKDSINKTSKLSKLNKALVRAALEGEATTVTEILKKPGASVEAEVEGLPLLIAVAARGHAQIVNLLIQAGANVHATDHETGTTALSAAVRNGYDTIVTDLIRAGARVDVATRSGLTPLHIAAQNKHLTIIRELLNAGSDVNARDIKGGTPIYHASHKGHNELVRQLITAGARINDADSAGATSLILAAQNGHSDVVQQLLIAGADVNAALKNGATALHMAVINHRNFVVEQLIIAGINVNAAGNSGITALHVAANHGYVDTLNTLLAQPQILINGTTEFGATPLKVALNYNQLVAAQLLIRNGARATPTEIAEAIQPNTLAYEAAIGNTDTLTTLLTQQQPPLELCEALLYATGQAHIEVVRQLVTAGAPIHPALNLVNMILRRPLDDPMRARYQTIRGLLEQPTQQITIAQQPSAPLTFEPCALPGNHNNEPTPQERLVFAAETGNVRQLRRALRDGASPDDHDEEGLTAAWRVALNHDEVISQNFLRLLILHGYNPYILHPQGISLMKWAIDENKLDLARLLLFHGYRTQPEIIRAIPLTRLLRAAALGNSDEVRDLLATRPSHFEIEDALTLAVVQRHREVVRLLIPLRGRPTNWPEQVIALMLDRAITNEDRNDYEEILNMIRQTPRAEEIPQAVIRAPLLAALNAPLNGPSRFFEGVEINK